MAAARATRVPRPTLAFRGAAATRLSTRKVLDTPPAPAWCVHLSDSSVARLDERLGSSNPTGDRYSLSAASTCACSMSVNSGRARLFSSRYRNPAAIDVNTAARSEDGTSHNHVQPTHGRPSLLRTRIFSTSHAAVYSASQPSELVVALWSAISLLILSEMLS